jgi:hypothetical protein
VQIFFNLIVCEYRGAVNSSLYFLSKKNPVLSYVPAPSFRLDAFFDAQVGTFSPAFARRFVPYLPWVE